jgi:MFS family permease
MDGRGPLTSPEITQHAATTRAIFAGRALRDFGDGFIAVLLPVYLIALGLGPFEIGLVATLALLGSALMTLAGR